MPGVQEGPEQSSRTPFLENFFDFGRVVFKGNEQVSPVPCKTQVTLMVRQMPQLFVRRRKIQPLSRLVGCGLSLMGIHEIVPCGKTHDLFSHS